MKKNNETKGAWAPFFTNHLYESKEHQHPTICHPRHYVYSIFYQHKATPHKSSCA